MTLLVLSHNIIGFVVKRYWFCHNEWKMGRLTFYRGRQPLGRTAVRPNKKGFRTITRVL